MADRDRFSVSAEYKTRSQLGSGGMAEVHEAFDTSLDRLVALKVLKPELSDDSDIRQRFITEAQITGQLDHPNIVPIYGLGKQEDGTVCIAMKMVQGESLGQILSKLRKGHRKERRQYSLHRLLQVFKQVCLAVQYAHSRSIIHRDLKPHNIMVGEFGEVLVMDWGLAKRKGDEEQRAGATIDSRPGATVTGTVFGTPPYMSPEQARGDVNQIDEQSDIYSLGAILYEVLTYYAPFKGSVAKGILDRIQTEPAVPPRLKSPNNLIPVALEEICMKALQKGKALRYRSAKEISEEIDRFVAGTKERERKKREADQQLMRGRHLAERWEQIRSYIKFLNWEIEATVRRTKPSDSVEQKKELWEIEDLRDKMLSLAARFFSRASEKLLQALGNVPEHRDSRELLSKLYYRRCLEARRHRNEEEFITFSNLLAQVDDGTYHQKLFGSGCLSVSVVPEGGDISVHRLVEVDRRRVPAQAAHLGRSPLVDVTLSPGSYLLMATRPDRGAIRYPLLMEASQDMVISLDFDHSQSREDGFVYVPGGVALIGGDLEGASAGESHKLFVEAFYIASYPATFEDYVKFLNDLATVDPDMARRRAPRLEPAGGHVLAEKDDGTWLLPTRDRYGRPHRPFLPVVGISWDDAMAYCTWLSERDGVSYRLPTGVEWEKAARGVDGRLYPWGDRFDPVFCKMRDSREGPCTPEPVGTFATDESVFGARGMAGDVREWCLSWYSEEAGLRMVRGGAWNLPRNYCRVTFVDGMRPDSVRDNLGFRLVREVESDTAGLPSYIREAAAEIKAPELPFADSGASDRLAEQMYAFDRFESFVEIVEEELKQVDVWTDTTPGPPLESDGSDGWSRQPVQSQRPRHDRWDETAHSRTTRFERPKK